MGKCGSCKFKGHCDTTSELYGVPKYNGGCQYYEQRSEDMKECCGNCKWHKHEDISDGWVCCNSDSEYVADWTEYNDWCEEYEEKE